MPVTTAFGARLLRGAVLAALALTPSGCLYTRIVYNGIPDLEAPTMFANRTVRRSAQPRPLPSRAHEARFQLSPSEKAHYGSFDRLLEMADTRAFLVLHDDEVVYERYFYGFDSETQLPGFSMTKTYAAVLVGRALDEGVLGSPNDSIVSYIPELASKPGYQQVTLDRLLRMTSGIDFSEESMAGAQLYYSQNLRNFMYSFPVTQPPGGSYVYGSINVQLLWDALHRRLGGRQVATYFQERIWGPLGATHDASWSLDSDESGIEKFFGGFNATARDHARLGLLFLHGGNLNGSRILSQAWVERSLTSDPIAGWVRTTDGLVRRGEYQWFLTPDGRGYFAKGYNGQYVFVAPHERTVFVRFGEGYGDVNWTALFLRLASQLNARQPQPPASGAAP
ncbi:MAG TPA: serine hydrolase [Polyangiaceae bacterium]